MNKSLESMETNLVEPLSLNGEEAEVLSLREKSVNPDMTYEEITNIHTTNEEPINTNGSTVCQESNTLSSTQVSAESTPPCDQSNREAKEEEPIIDLTMKRSATVKRKHPIRMTRIIQINIPKESTDANFQRWRRRSI